MPSKRTNDSVDRILEELSHEQAERGIRDSVTDRQVDAILQSLGHGSMEESSGGGSALGPIQKEDLPDITLGKGNNFNTEDRFSTAVLDDLLGDLPSMRAAKKNKPGPAAPARRPASVPEPRRMPEVEPKVEKQNNIQTVQPTQPVRSEPVPQPARPAPAQTAPQQPAPQVQPETKPAPQPEPRPADATSGDTTRTSVIKAFLGRRVPEADSKYLDEGKKDFTNFFGTSVAVVPDDMKSEQERQQTPKKKGLFGFGYATDTGEFEPINVSVSGRVENQSTQQLEEQLPRLQDEPDEMELREQEPPRHYAAKKKGFFASLFGGKKHDVYDELESYDPYEGEPAPVENWEVPEQPREEPKKRSQENVVELPEEELKKNRKPRRHLLRRAAAVLCFGVVFSAVTLVVYNQVQLTELTEEINTTAKQLEEAESLEIQLNMEASAQMDGAAVEQYAQEELGMSKVSGGQVTYVNVAQEDQGTVVREATSGSFWENLWSTIQSWFQ